MKPLKLYIENFMCYDHAYIDFSKFDVALIIGAFVNNDLHSNGVGKTTIFKAIEYVLFNSSDMNIENIIRDDTDMCKIVFDFEINSQVYRIVRKRTKKAADFSMFQRTTVVDNIDTYHTLLEEPTNLEKYWKDISGRRTSDTEKTLQDLIKINIKSFRNLIHFRQNDFSSLTDTTSEKRKTLFKEALNIIIYAKLEKIAKEKASIFEKQIENINLSIANIGNPDEDINNIKSNIMIIDQQIREIETKISENLILINKDKNKIDLLKNNYSSLKSGSNSIILQEKSLSLENIELNNQINDLTDKKSTLLKSIKIIIDNITNIKNSLQLIQKIDKDQLDRLSLKIKEFHLKLNEHNYLIRDALSDIKKLQVPFPDGDKCQRCRQSLSKNHRDQCIENDNIAIQNYNKVITNSQNIIKQINKELLQLEEQYNNADKILKKFDQLTHQQQSLENDLISKNTILKTYEDVHSNTTIKLSKNNEDLNNIRKELEKSSFNNLKNLKLEIDANIQGLNEFISSSEIIKKQLSTSQSNKAVLEYSLDEKIKSKNKLLELQEQFKKLSEEYKIFPYVVKGFSSTGIPNLMIQNLLDDLQYETNSLLLKLRPDLQMTFVLEKENIKETDEEQDAVLDIKYLVKGRKRYYEQLSGAMKLAAAFSIKLALSSILQKVMNIDIKFLLLDEIDQSLDKATIDVFADIIKLFQHDFTILVITHNDRLKDKFKKYILVDQDINMVSNAKVITC